MNVHRENQGMWARNLLFLGLLGAGGVGLGALLYPPAVPARGARFRPAETDSPGFRDLVDRVDAAVRATWKDRGLEPAPLVADDLALARRVSLALTGTIPSLQEIRQLESHPAEQRLQWWLAGLFEDRRYADYLAERLARAYVGTENGPFVVFRRRRFVTWLSDQLLQNRPYNEIVEELIAAQGLWTDRPATNFVTVTIEPDNNKGPNPARLAGRVARAFLGVRLDCAQCHNHPFQSVWTQQKFQGLAAFFGQVHQGFTGIYDAGGDYEFDKRIKPAPGDRSMEARIEKVKVEPGVPFLPELLPAEGTRRQRLAEWVTHPGNSYFARATVNRLWALLFNRPLLEPIDDLPLVEEKKAGAGEEKTLEDVLQLLADDFAVHGYDLRRLIKVLVATEAFRRDSKADHELTEDHDKYLAAFPLTRLRPEQVVGSLLQAAKLETVNGDSNVFVRLIAYANETAFVQRYGDTGEDEFSSRGGTIPQRLLLMNGELVHERTREELANAATRIAWLAGDDRTAVETAYLAVLTRRPTPEEAEHFEKRLAGAGGPERSARVEDLYWTLLNSTEFSWNH
jgi:hypothetical protein